MNKKLRKKINTHRLTGISGIDVQHRELFLKIDRFMDSLKNGNPSTGDVHADIDDILENLRSHLATEERLMEIIAFPKAEEHKANHRNILNMVTEEMKILKNTDNKKIFRFVSSYRHIAAAHIAVFDHDYVQFIRKLTTAKNRLNVAALRTRALAG